MSNLRYDVFLLALVLVAGISGYTGYKAAKWEQEHLICGSYQKGHSYWNGWLSVKDGVTRCFWLESQYPWRVRQGVVLVNGE